MNKEIAKNYLRRYESSKDDYRIPMDLASEDISEAILCLCSNSNGKWEGYVLTGCLSKGERYYVVYKPDSNKVGALHKDSKNYYKNLCVRMRGNIFNLDNEGDILANLDIKSYESNKDNCKQVLDDILIKNYKDKYSGKVDFLMVLTFTENMIMYFNVD